MRQVRTSPARSPQKHLTSGMMAARPFAFETQADSTRVERAATLGHSVSGPISRPATSSAPVAQMTAMPRNAESDGTAQRSLPDLHPARTGLPDTLKIGIERLSGMSLNRVRVHYGSPRPAALNALAFARGSEIHLAPGQHRHLPHEAWHIVQQAQGRVRPMVRRAGVFVNTDPALESEATRMGRLSLMEGRHAAESAERAASVESPRTATTATAQLQPGEGDDPAHRFWDRFNPMRRFAREGGRGLLGYTQSHFETPSMEPHPAVASDPARLDWHNRIVGMLRQRTGPEFLLQQWLLQNRSQALGGNPLPVEAGNQMLHGATMMGNANSIGDLLRGHRHAQMASLGGRGFTGAASYLMHGLSIPWQWPTLIGHGLMHGAQSLTQNPIHPMRALTRAAGRNPRTAWLAALGSGAGAWWSRSTGTNPMEAEERQ